MVFRRREPRINRGTASRPRIGRAGSLLLVSTAALIAAWSSGSASQAPAAEQLRPLKTFASITDQRQRSRALYAEASRVLLHPRCVNCHPSDDTPRQGDAQAVHEPPVFRGPADRGLPAMQCSSCHQDHNLNYARVPGAPEWHVAPVKMAWLGRTPAQICAQIKDPARNGGKTLQQLHEHMAADALVGWAWAPGSGRRPAPGTQKEFGALIRAWIETGAECPTEEVSR